MYVFSIVAATKNAKYAITQNIKQKIYTVQFNHEVVHTKHGKLIFKNFIFNVCKCKKNWTDETKLEKIIFEIKKTVGKKKVLCALSGGVDSSVLAHILKKALNNRVYCVYIDTGLMRKNESKDIVSIYRKKFKKNFIYLNEGRLFLKIYIKFLTLKKKEKL